MSGTAGRLGISGPSAQQVLQSISDWYVVKTLDLSTVSANVVIATAYPGLVLKRITTSGTADVAVVVHMANEVAGTNVTFNLPASSGDTGKTPIIDIIVDSGTSATGTINLWFQRISD